MQPEPLPPPAVPEGTPEPHAVEEDPENHLGPIIKDPWDDPDQTDWPNA